MHGFALNYLPQQAKFSVINPCGHPGTVITSISEESPKNQEKIDYQHLVSFIKAALSASLIWPRGE
jgi:lipoate-protein ligase B